MKCDEAEWFESTNARTIINRTTILLQHPKLDGTTLIRPVRLNSRQKDAEVSADEHLG